MKTICLLAALIAYGFFMEQGNSTKSRSIRRRIMGKKFPDDYITYGCYCGQRGKGIPKDDIDRCCWTWLCCNMKLTQDCKFNEAELIYRRVLGASVCGNGSYCENRVCDCGYHLQICILNIRRSYNVKYRNLTNSQCVGEAPKCPELLSSSLVRIDKKESPNSNSKAPIS